MQRFIFLTITTLALANIGKAALITTTYTNAGGDHLWLTASNWSPPGSPNNTSIDQFAVTIPAGLATPVEVTGQRTIDTLDLDLGSIVDVKNGAILIFQGSVNNNGLIRLNGSAVRLFFDERNDAPVSLLGSGKVLLQGSSDSVQGSINQHLTNGSSHTIEGAGLIGVNRMNFINQGTILANLSGQDLSIDPNATFVNDGGTVRVENGASLTLQTGMHTSINGGSYEIADDAELRLSGAAMQNLTFTPDDQDSDLNNNIVRIASSTSSLAGGVVNDSRIVFNSNALLLVTGNLENNGVIDQLGGGDTFVDSPTDIPITLSGSGSLILNSRFQDTINGPVAQLFIHGTEHTIRGTGSIGLNRLNIINQGTITADVPGETLLIDPNTTFLNDGGTVTTANGGRVQFDTGTYSAANDGRYLLQDGEEIFFNGVPVTGGTFELEDHDGTILNNTPTFSNTTTFSGITNNGFINVPTTGQFRLAGNITNNGLIRIGEITDLFLLGSDNDTPVGFYGTGRVEIPDSSAVAPNLRRWSGTRILRNGPGHTLACGGMYGIVNDSVFPSQTTTLINEGVLELGAGPANMRINQLSGLLIANEQLGPGVITDRLGITILGGEFHLPGAVNTQISMSGNSILKIHGERIGNAAVTPGNGDPSGSGIGLQPGSIGMSNTTVIEFQIHSESSFDKLQVSGWMTLGGALRLKLTGPASGFNSSSSITIASQESAGSPGNGFFGNIDIDFNNVVSGARLVTADGRASFLVTIVEMNAPSFMTPSSGSVTLSNPLFAPEFAAASYSFTIPPGAALNSPVGTVSAIDPESATVTYSLAPASPFSIDPNTGTITVANVAGVATPSTFELLVTATDGTLSNTISVTVYVGTIPVTNATCVEALLSGSGGVFEGSTDLTIIAATADPDSDGVENLFELWTGTDPSNIDGLPPITFGQQRISPYDYASLEVTVSAAMDDALTVGAEISSDLETWRPAQREVLYEIGTTRTIRFRDTEPGLGFATIPRSFARFTADMDAVK